MRHSLSTPILIIAAAFAASHGAAQQTPVQKHGALSVRGNRIIGSRGQPVQLRGMSLFWSQWMPQYYNADCIRWLRDDWNCEIVRVAMGVGAGGYLAHPDAEVKKAETAIDAAIGLGMYVIIDWHAHEPETERACEFFSKIAAKYGHHPNIIYETYNEPLNRHDWSKVIKPYHEAVVKSIRAHDPDNLIVLGTQTWSQDVDKAAADPVAGDNIAYTLHFYAGTHKQWLRDKATAAMDKGIALFVTEWGTCNANGDGPIADEEVRAWLNFMDEHKLSWCNWSVADKRETSAALLPGAASTGNWPAEMISPSGRLVRSALRREPLPTTQPH